MSLEPSPSGRSHVHGAFVLRDAVVSDAERIEAVHWAAREAVYDGRVSDWPPEGPDRAGRVERWRSWLGSPDVTCIVGEHGGRIVGFVTIRASRDEDATPAVSEMPTLYVDPGAWRRGLGGALCRSAVERARDLGFSELTLWVVEVNQRARTFYDAFGFAPDGATQLDEGTHDRLLAHRYRLTLGDAR